MTNNELAPWRRPSSFWIRHSLIIGPWWGLGHWSSFPIWLPTSGQQRRSLDRHLEQSHLVLILAQRAHALARGLAGGCGCRLGNLLAFQYLGRGLAYQRCRGDVAEDHAHALREL